MHNLTPEQIIADLRERAEWCDAFSDCQGPVEEARWHYRRMADYVRSLAERYERGELMVEEEDDA